MRRFVASSTAVLLGLLLSGCKDDLKPVTATWNTTATEWQAKVDALKADDAEQAQKVISLCSTEGLDPTNVAAKTCAEMKVSTESDKAQLEALTTAMTRNRAVVDAAIKRGKLLEVTVAMEAAKSEMTTLLARVSDNAQLRRDATKGLQAAVTQEFEAAKAAAIAAEAKAALWADAATERKPLELTDIRFTKGTAQLEPAEAGEQTQLQEIVAWANSCPALSFSITAHASKEIAAADAKKMTDGRALAVKKFLVENGVAPSKIASAVGVGAKKPVVDEPEPTSQAAKDMNPDELEALRNKNRGITVQAVELCPRERAELTAP